MRLNVLDEGYWELSKMREIEYYFLKQIGAAADARKCPEAESRLFPGKAVEGEEEGADVTTDWGELVVPEIKKLFQDAVTQVEDDMEKVVVAEREGGEPIYSLRIPAEHADQWYSALNQARLVLAERYDLPMTEAELEAENETVDERWLAFAQSNIYAFVQSFLLDTVLRYGDGGCVPGGDEFGPGGSDQ